MVNARLEGGANQTMIDSYGRPPAELALLEGHVDVVLLLSETVENTGLNCFCKGKPVQGNSTKEAQRRI